MSWLALSSWLVYRFCCIGCFIHCWKSRTFGSSVTVSITSSVLFCLCQKGTKKAIEMVAFLSNHSEKFPKYVSFFWIHLILSFRFDKLDSAIHLENYVLLTNKIFSVHQTFFTTFWCQVCYIGVWHNIGYFWRFSISSSPIFWQSKLSYETFFKGFSSAVRTNWFCTLRFSRRHDCRTKLFLAYRALLSVFFICHAKM